MNWHGSATPAKEVAVKDEGVAEATSMGSKEGSIKMTDQEESSVGGVKKTCEEVDDAAKEVARDATKGGDIKVTDQEVGAIKGGDIKVTDREVGAIKDGEEADDAAIKDGKETGGKVDDAAKENGSFNGMQKAVEAGDSNGELLEERLRKESKVGRAMAGGGARGGEAATISPTRTATISPRGTATISPRGTATISPGRTATISPRRTATASPRRSSPVRGEKTKLKPSVAAIMAEVGVTEQNQVSTNVLRGTATISPRRTATFSPSSPRATPKSHSAGGDEDICVNRAIVRNGGLVEGARADAAWNPRPHVWGGELVEVTPRGNWYAHLGGIRYDLRGQPRSQRMIFRAYSSQKVSWLTSMADSSLLLSGVVPRAQMERWLIRALLEKTGGRHGFNVDLVRSLAVAEIRAMAIIQYPRLGRQLRVPEDDDEQIKGLLGYRLALDLELASTKLVKVSVALHGPWWRRRSFFQLWLRDTRAMLSMSHVHEHGVLINGSWFIAVRIQRRTRSPNDFISLETWEVLGRQGRLQTEDWPF